MAGYICTACGYEGAGRKQKRGSRTVEIGLWVTLLIPGPFYSMWRRFGVARVCTQCGKPSMVRKNSNAGRMAEQKLNAALGMYVPQQKDDIRVSFGNERAEQPKVKKPVDPDQF